MMHSLVLTFATPVQAEALLMLHNEGDVVCEGQTGCFVTTR